MMEYYHKGTININRQAIYLVIFLPFDVKLWKR